MDIIKLIRSIGIILFGVAGGIFALTFRETSAWFIVITVGLFIIAFTGLLDLLIVIGDEIYERNTRTK
jgi:hypothetical protein